MDTKKRLSRRSILASGLTAGAGLLLPFARVLASPDAALAQHTGDGAPGDSIGTDLLIIGAGPFGLALAAYAQEQGIRHVVVGAPMGFWKTNMPQGMFLRSTCDWSLDPLDVHSIDAYLKKIRRSCTEVEPLSRNFYLDYAGWFQDEKDIRTLDVTVASLDTDEGELVAVTDRGERIRSRFVVLAIGFGSFAHVPAELAPLFPRERYDHTCHLVDFGPLEDQRLLIIGGRQSAFEWAALMRESGVRRVDLCYRHDTPSFTPSDWSWVNALVARMGDDPGWYRRLSENERQQVNERFWTEGRLKLEPWLADRIDHPNVKLHPRTEVTGAHASDSGIRVALNSGETLIVDHVVLATGYEVNLARVPFLASGLLSNLGVREGFPVLDQHFQTNVPGLYVTSLAATRDFGAFLGFTVSVRAQAKIIGRHIAGNLQQARAPHSRFGTTRAVTGSRSVSERH